MRKTNWLKTFKTIGLALILGVSLTGCGKSSWKEEVQLHDGSKIIVERSVSYGGRHEVGQGAPVKEQEITFTVPKSNKIFTFKSEYGEELGRTNFYLLALHILGDTPYIIAEPNLCLSYNKWGRPNPPYVIFKHDGKAWQRISIQQLPPEFKDINLVIEVKGEQKTIMVQPIVTTEIKKELNEKLTQYPQYQSILREAYAGMMGGCEVLIKYKGYWIMPNDPVARGMVDRKSK
jgi:hypothetical protein